MNKAALTAYLNNTNLDPSGVYGYYEFNTGRKQFLYNNYYSGQPVALSSITGFTVTQGGGLYSSSDVGTVYSTSGEHKNIPFRVTVNGGGTILTAYIDAGNVGGNVQANVIGGVGTGLYYETPTTFVASTNGENAIIDPIMFINYDYGTRYDLNPLVAVSPTTGTIKSGISLSSALYGSGFFSGRDCLRFSSGFSDTNWTMFLDMSIKDSFAVGKSEVLLTSYDNWITNKGFAVTIDDSFHLNFEYKTSGAQIQNIPLNIELQDNNLISISKDQDNNTFIFGRHNLTEDSHTFQKIEVFYSGNNNLFIGGFSGGIYSNTGYTGFSGYVGEILFLNQSCNEEQLSNLSNLFAITGYTVSSTKTVTGYYPIVTGIDSDVPVIASSGIVGYDLISGDYGGGTGYIPSGIVSGIIETGTIIYYDPVQSGVSEDIVVVDEIFSVDTGLKNKYAENVLSFENELQSTDLLEIYSFNSYDSSQPNNFDVVFSAVPGKLYLKTGIDASNFSLFENGVFQMSGKDYDFYKYRSVIDSTPYRSYSNSKEEEVFNCSIPNTGFLTSGFTFTPSAGSNYTYSNFPFSLDNNTGYFLYLNGQKLVSGASYDYTIAGTTLTINNSVGNYDTGTIDIAGIRSGDSRNYINAYGTFGASLYVSGFSYRLIDEVIFLNGQRLKKNDDYYKTSSGKLNLRNSNVPNQIFNIFSGQTGFFNV